MKVSQTGNAVWSRADNSVSIGRYRQSGAAADTVQHAPRLSQQSPETQTGGVRERERE